jgi:hypothetical protein
MNGLGRTGYGVLHFPDLLVRPFLKEASWPMAANIAPPVNHIPAE